MDLETQIRAWKDPKFRQTLDAEHLPQNPAGIRLVELGDDEMRSIWGADGPGDIKYTGSEGYICSVSGECTPTGNPCWVAP